MSQERRQDFAYPPGPRPKQDRKDKGNDWEIESPSRVSQLRTQFSVLRGDEQAILAVLRRVPWLDRFNARIALYQALCGPYFGGGAKAIELCEQVFGKGSVDFPSERVYWEQASAPASASPPAPKKPPAPPSREALRAQALRELLVKRVRAGNRPDERELDLLLGGLELGVVSRALLDMKEHVVPGDPASPTCQAALWEQERSYNLRSQFPYYLRAERPGPETFKVNNGRAHEVPRFVTETLTVPRFAGRHVLGSWETNAYKTWPEAALNDSTLGELSQTGGEPLPEALLQRMNRLFAHDFAHVRIHTDAQAARAAVSLGARALAIGQHLYFGENQFTPGTPTGDRLLVHELMHVVQFDQGRLPPIVGLELGISRPEDTAEREASAAERLGDRLASPDSRYAIPTGGVGVGEVGDTYEQHADAVADAVVQGKSSEALLDGYAGTVQPQPDAHRGSGEELQQTPSATRAGQAVGVDRPADRFRYRQVDDAGGGDSTWEGETAACVSSPLESWDPGGSAPGQVKLTSRLDTGFRSDSGGAEPIRSLLISDPSMNSGRPATGGADPFAAQLPYQAEMERAFGEDLSGVEVRLGGAGGAGQSALTTSQGGRDVVAFDSTSPSLEQVAHELTHVVQRRHFGEGAAGFSRMDDASEHEARDLGALAAAGHTVDVRTAPAAAMQRDGDVAQNIHDKLHAFIDDEAGALADLRRDRDRRTTCRVYRERYRIALWTDFIDNASGAILNEALSLLWPYMTLVERLGTRLGTFDDDEAGILQTIQSASDAEARRAGDALLPFIMQLAPPDRFTARQKVWPDRAVENVGHLIREGHGWIYDDEGPMATAIMNLSPTQRLEVWNRYQNDIRGVFSSTDAERIHRMCESAPGVPATDANAARVRMVLATEGAGTDEEGVLAAVAAAGGRRDELERIRVFLEGGRGPDGRPLTETQRRALERRRAEIGDVGALLTPTTTSDGRLDENTFLGRVAGDMDAATVDSALTTAHADAFTRAKQALLLTLGMTGIDPDEGAALNILRGIQGEVELAPGETLESLGASEIRRRRERSAAEIRTRLLRDPDLREVWAALDTEEGAYAAALGRGDTYQQAIGELTQAFSAVDTDHARILRVIRDMAPEDRERLRRENPSILVRIRSWPFSDRDFLAAFEDVLVTGRINPELALSAAFGTGMLGKIDGTDEDMANDVLAGISDADRALLRRGYLLHHAGTGSPAAPRTLTPSDAAALTAYRDLHARLDSEYSDEELDAALVTLIGLPTVAEMQTDQGRLEAATIMMFRQRERLEMTAGLTDYVTTTDDTAAIAHVEFESRYNQALEQDGKIDEDEFAVLVTLDQQFNSRFREYADTANLVSEIAGTVAAVAAAAVVIIASGGAAAAASPGVIAWLSANSTLIVTSAATSALAQVVVSEGFGGDFNEMAGADGARQMLSGAVNGMLAVCGAALAERAATLVGLSGRALTAQIARAAADATKISVAGRAFARGALTGLIDGSLGGAVGELAMTLTDAETWRRSVWDVLARAGAALLRGGFLGGLGGAATGGLMEMASAQLQRRALRDVAVHMEDSLGGSAQVDFQVDPDTGVISNLGLRFGPMTTEGDIVAHVERLAIIRRAGRTLENARRLATNAGHAEQEVAKIERMIRDRLVQLRMPLSPDSRALIEAELDVFQANLDEFGRVARSGDVTLGSGTISRPEAPPGYPPPPEHHYYRRRGSGWDLQLYPDSPPETPRFTLEPDGNGGFRAVSREGARAATSLPFPDGTTAEQAFLQLTGADSRSSFKQYWEMLRDNHLATRDEVIAAMLPPAGRSEDSVRHALKEFFEPRVLARTLRDAEGRTLSEAESMLALRGLTQNLNPSDRGNLTEAWYLARHEGLSPHPSMTAEANPGVVGRGGRGVRNPDFVDGATLGQLKSTRIGLTADEIVQINDDLLVAARNGTVTLEGGTVRYVTSVRLVFTDVRGARGAAEQLAEWLDEHAFLTLEVFGTNGVPVRIRQDNLHELLNRHGVATLQALLGAL